MEQKVKIEKIKNEKKVILRIRKSEILNKKPIFLEGRLYMSRNRSIMSENLKEEIAKELGVYEQVKKDGGWENVSSKDCGNIVTKAIEIANRSVKQQKEPNKIKKYLIF